MENEENYKLPLEMYKEILLKSDFKTALEACQSSKELKQLCDKYFWIQISKNEGFPLKDDASVKDVNEWIKKYFELIEDVDAILKIVNDLGYIIIDINEYTNNIIFNFGLNAFNYTNNQYFINGNLIPDIKKVLSTLLFKYSDKVDILTIQGVHLRKRKLENQYKFNKNPRIANDIKEIWEKYYL